MKLSRIVQLLAGLAISAAGVWIFMKDVDLPKLGQELAGGNYASYAAAMVLAVAAIWVRAVRMRILLPSMPGTHKRGFFSYVMICFMLNNIMPARIGEAARVVLLWKKNAFPVATAVGAMVLERVLDTCAILTMFFVPALLVPRLAPVRIYALALLAACAATVTALAAFALFPQSSRTVAGFWVKLLPARLRDRASTLLDQLMSSLAWVHSPPRVLAMIALTYAVALCYASTILALAGDYSLAGLVTSIFAQSCAAFGAAIPLSPGYVGTLHAAMLQGLTMMGMEADKGRALAILYHALSYIPVTVWGLYFFFKTDIRLRDISQPGAGPRK